MTGVATLSNIRTVVIAGTVCLGDSASHSVYLWVHVVDTTNTHDEGQLSLILNIEATLLLGLTLESN